MKHRVQLLAGVILAASLAAVPSGVRATAPRAGDARFEALAQAAIDLDRDVLARALAAHDCARARGEVTRETLTVIDYSRPSTEKRLWVLDLSTRTLRFHELVAHGKATGENLATRFSNVEGSHQTSLGLFRTLGTYRGKHGLSLKLAGLEDGVNDAAEERAIVIHGAWYVSQAFTRKYGRLGRSFGCPAVSQAIHAELIDAIKDGASLFAWYPDESWAGHSAYLAPSCTTQG